MLELVERIQRLRRVLGKEPCTNNHPSPHWAGGVLHADPMPDGNPPRFFSVTDPDEDAPDGAELYLEQYKAWYRRSGLYWSLIERPGEI